MREIVFKAKRKLDGAWVIGDLSQHKTGKKFIRLGGGSSTHSYEVDVSTICQFTGMTDKNGNKIWENDIVKGTFFGFMLPVENYVSEISWQECIGGWGSNFWHSDIEVIGNKFDNPELLEGGAE